MTSTVEKEAVGMTAEESTHEAPQSVDDIFGDIFNNDGQTSDPDRLDRLRADFAEAVFEYRDTSGEVHRGNFETALGCSAFKLMLLRAESYEDAFSVANTHKKEVTPEEGEEILDDEEHEDELSEEDAKPESRRDEETRPHETKTAETQSRKEKATDKDKETIATSDESVQDKKSDIDERAASDPGDANKEQEVEKDAAADTKGGNDEVGAQDIDDREGIPRVTDEAARDESVISSKSATHTRSRSWRESSATENSQAKAHKELDHPLPLPGRPPVSQKPVVTAKIVDSNPTHHKTKEKLKPPVLAAEHVTGRPLDDGRSPDKLADQHTKSLYENAPRTEINEGRLGGSREAVAVDEAVRVEVSAELEEVALDLDDTGAGEEITFFERVTNIASDKERRDGEEATLVSKIEPTVFAHIEEETDGWKDVDRVHLDEALLNIQEVEDESDEEPIEVELIATNKGAVRKDAGVLDIEQAESFEGVQELVSEEKAARVEVVLERVVRLAQQEEGSAIPSDVLKVMKKIQKHTVESKKGRTNADAKYDSQLLTEELTLLLRTLGYKHPEQLLASFLERHSIEYLMTIFGSVTDVSKQPHASRVTLPGKLKSFIATKIGKHALMKALLRGRNELAAEGS